MWYRIGSIGVLAAAMMLVLGSRPGMAQSGVGTAEARAHVYLLRGLMNIFLLPITVKDVMDSTHWELLWLTLLDMTLTFLMTGKLP